MNKKIFRACFFTLIFFLVFTLTVSAKPKTSLDRINDQQSGGFTIFVPVIKRPDISAPTVVSSIPIKGAVGIETTANIIIQFSEAIRQDTITSTTIRLRNSSNTVVTSVLTYNPSLFSVTIDPSSNFGYSSSYTVTVLGGASGVKDLAGNSMSTSQTITFTTVPDPTPSGAIVADHNSISSFSSIPPTYLQAAAAIKTLFMHQSTGESIDYMGLKCLAGLRNWEDFPQECSTYAPNDPYDDRNWNWQIWAEPMADAPGKTDEWVSVVNAQQQNYTVLGMKFCYVDGWNQDFDYYKTKMEQLEQAYPQKTFIWSTSVLWAQSEVGGNLDSATNIQTFNQQLRAYARANNKVLYDLADIESHDPNGNFCQSNGVEALCTAYYTGMGGGGGGHPDVNGSIRLAKGFWHLMARISGWSGN